MISGATVISITAHAGSHVLYAGSERMNLIIDDEKTVVVTVRKLDKLNFRIL